LWTHSSLGPSRTLRKESLTLWLFSLRYHGYCSFFKAISISLVSIVAIFSIVTVDFLLTMILLLLWLSWLPALSLSLVAFIIDYLKAPQTFRYMDVLILLFLGSDFCSPVLTARTFAPVTSTFCFWVLLEHCDIQEVGVLTGFLKLLNKFPV